MTAKQINSYLKSHDSPLAGYGNAFVRAGRKYGVSPALLVAIAGAESSFGKINSGSHNAWGWGPGIDFPSWQAGIEGIAKGLRTGYLNEGRKSVKAIGAKWAPAGASNDPTNLNSNWATNVQKFLTELGSAQPLGGPVSPATGTEPSAPTSAPQAADLSSAAFESLGKVSKGYDALASLSELTDTVASAGNVGSGAEGGPATADVSDPAPIKGGITWSGQKSTHQTSGLEGYPAVDLFAKPGTPFRAPENGKVIRLSGHGGTKGQVYGYSVYFQGESGKVYFITHLNQNRPAPGTRVRKGQRLGSVSKWSGGSPHAHVGVNG